MPATCKFPRNRTNQIFASYEVVLNGLYSTMAQINKCVSILVDEICRNRQFSQQHNHHTSVMRNYDIIVAEEGTDDVNR